ncbi:MAG: BNR repeat-containing protein [Opitutaceae bacterium]
MYSKSRYGVRLPCALVCLGVSLATGGVSSKTPRSGDTILPRAGARFLPIAEGWAKNSINTVVFRRNSVASHEGTQFTAFYDPEGGVLLARRKHGDSSWQIHRTGLKGNIQDAHNSISLMPDGAGILHLAWNHHNDPLHYCRTLDPETLELTGPLPMTGKNELRVTYPELHRLPDGDLLFLYRDGASGNGNLVINRFRASSGEWMRVHDVVIDGEGARNAYWQACIDNSGTLHLSWVWRESPDVASNHDLCYARSHDGGVTWEDSRGRALRIPIRESTAEVVARIPQGSALINQTSMTAGPRGNPIIATYWRPDGARAPQYHIVRLTPEGWKIQQVGARTLDFELGGAGAKRIPISRPQVVAGASRCFVFFSDEERGRRVSVAACDDLERGLWSIEDLTEATVGQWEPTLDTERWRTNQEIHLFVQRTAQGDGEQLEDLPPQPAGILEWRP